MTNSFADSEPVMRRAIELALGGMGSVEPNPAVGAVIVDENLALIAEGFHHRFGGPHAEIEALRQAGSRAAGATLFVTLEPCCHHGKTGPCTAAVIASGIRKVVIGVADPSPEVGGRGIAELRSAGVDVDVGLLEAETLRLVAPFVKRVTVGMPYVHAKWAMTLDGKIATRTGASRWISNEASREIVHRLRGRMDAIVVGKETARIDNPLLLARPPGPRVATRIVVDSGATLSLDSQLMRTIEQGPVLIATSESADESNIHRLRHAGAEVVVVSAGKRQRRDELPTSRRAELPALFRELGSRGMTNVLVEGGSRLFGSCLDQKLIDEVHVFIAAKLVGGEQAVSAVGGIGNPEIPEFSQLEPMDVDIVDGDVYIHGPLR